MRQSTRDLIADRDRLRRALLAKEMILFEPAGDVRLWTSDHPVVRHSRMPVGETGFESLGVEVYLPLAADLMLGFLCPSLKGVMVESVGGGATTALSMDALRRRGTPLRAADPVIRLFNACRWNRASASSTRRTMTSSFAEWLPVMWTWTLAARNSAFPGNEGRPFNVALDGVR